MRRIVFLAALLLLHCADGQSSVCDNHALGIEAGASVDDGVEIAEVLPRSPADLAGIRRGDLLVSIGGHDIRYACEVAAMVSIADVWAVGWSSPRAQPRDVRRPSDACGHMQCRFSRRSRVYARDRLRPINPR